MGESRQPTFVEFCTWLGITLEAGQLVFCLVAYDHVDPCDLPPEQREIARQLFGNVDRVPPKAHRVIASVIGGRSGKTYLATIRLLHLCCTVGLDGFVAAGQRAHAAIIAPDVETAMEATAYFVGACAKHPKLRRCIDRRVIEKVIEKGLPVKAFVFRRPRDGRFVHVAVKAVRRGGANVRGRWFVGALMDEACLFYDSSYKLSDDQVYKAIKPRLVTGAQLLLSSTPWLDTGVLFSLWETQFGTPDTALVAHAPTLVLRPHHAHTREVVEAEYASDEENARREFGAEFGIGGPADWFDRQQLRASVEPGACAPAAVGEQIGAGGDLGFKKNSSTLVLTVHTPKTGRYRSVRLEERRPQMGHPLNPSEVCSEFAALLAAAGVEQLVADQHYAESAREALDKAALLLAHPPEPEEVWTLVRDLVRQGLVKIPGGTAPAKLLLTQLQAVKFRRVAKGRVVILLEETRDGRHGDLAAAWALSVWGALRRGTVVRAAAPPLPSLDEQEERLLAEEEREEKKPWWM